MRAQYDNTCDFVTGPGAPIPGVVSFFGPCRVVTEIEEVIATSPLSERLAYITTSSGVPVGPGVVGGPSSYTTDYLQADTVAIPSGNVPTYQVMFVETVTPFGRPSYQRAHVRLLPTLPVLGQEDFYPLVQEDLSLIVVT
jgi:hypothetical protein